MPRRFDAALAATLVGAVVFLDLLWSLLAGSTGTLAYGLVDEPAHLATCAVLLLALVAVAGRALPARFAVAALVASVAIDVDHIPGYLGSHLATGALPRPYSHSLLAVALVLGVAACLRGDRRQVALGIAFGFSAHFLRDLATGPGIAFLWPVSQAPIKIPYALFAGTLALVVSAWLPRQAPAWAGRLGLFALAGAVALAAIASSAPAARAGSEVAMGAYIPNSDYNPSLIDQYAAETGRTPTIVHTYKDWEGNPFDADELNAVWNRGATPLVTWEPWSWNDPGKRFPLGAIAKGRYDAYIHSAARAAAAWGHPLMVRFAHEMNGIWYPWDRAKPRTFKHAWRHVVRLFREDGAGNVEWVWTPYVDNGSGQRRFEAFYPGDRWVDWPGLDGLNWGGSKWQSFGKVFADSYRRMVKLTSRPLIIAETGSSEDGGSKAAWIARALDRVLPRMGHVKALLWWSADDWRGDFRVDSSPGALDSLRLGLQRPAYQVDRQRLLATPRLLVPRSRGPAGH